MRRFRLGWPQRTVPQRTVPDRTTVYTIPCFTIPYFTTPYCTILPTVPYFTISYYTILPTVPYRTVYTIPCFTIPSTVLYRTVPACEALRRSATTEVARPPAARGGAPTRLSAPYPPSPATQTCGAPNQAATSNQSHGNSRYSNSNQH